MVGADCVAASHHRARRRHGGRAASTAEAAAGPAAGGKGGAASTIEGHCQSQHELDHEAVSAPDKGAARTLHGEPAADGRAAGVRWLLPPAANPVRARLPHPQINCGSRFGPLKGDYINGCDYCWLAGGMDPLDAVCAVCKKGFRLADEEGSACGARQRLFTGLPARASLRQGAGQCAAIRGCKAPARSTAAATACARALLPR